MIEEKEELQGQLIASGNIVASMISQKGAKGDPGEQGIPGVPGVPGQDGFSPIASISKTGKVATITITDSQGTTTAEIRDGEDGLGSGDMLKATYDTNNTGVVDNAEKVNNHTVLSNVPANAVFTDTTYTAGTNVSISAQNVISATDTTYTAGTGIEITAGNVINNTQTSAEWGNISGDIDDQTDLQNILADKVDSSDLSTVATSGSYNDLSNKPTIPTKVSDLTNDSGFINKNVNDLTNYTTTNVINTLLAGKENDIFVQETAPQSPEENDLWIDTDDNNRLKYYDGTSWVYINNNVLNTRTNSQDDTYSCDYENKYFGGVELYNDSTGSAGEITLSDSKDNYSSIKILYTSTVEDSYEFNPKSGATLKITLGTKYKTGSLFIQTIGTYICSGNKLTPQLAECGYSTVSSSGSAINWDNVNYCNIKKVIGYK